MKNITLIVGHRKSSQGAVNNTYNLSEWEFNSVVAKTVKSFIDRTKAKVTVLYRDDDANGWGKLPAKVNATKPDYIFSFHCNAASESAKGNEVLYWFTSKTGKTIATKLNDAIFNALQVKKRNILAIESVQDRGGNLLKNTYAPCVIIEPAFFSNDEDTTNLLHKMTDYTKAVADVINDLCK